MEPTQEATKSPSSKAYERYLKYLQYILKATKIVARTKNAHKLLDTVAWRFSPASAIFGNGKGLPVCIGAIAIGIVSFAGGVNGNVMTAPW